MRSGVRPWRRLSPLVLLIGSLAAVTSFGAEKPQAAPSVQVAIDYGDGCQKHFTAIAWMEGMTVFDAMEAADRHPRGIEWKYRGKGTTALLERIDDLENEGAGKNWVYRVNGKLADRGMGVYELKSGDTILWKFENIGRIVGGLSGRKRGMIPREDLLTRVLAKENAGEAANLV